MMTNFSVDYQQECCEEFVLIFMRSPKQTGVQYAADGLELSIPLHSIITFIFVLLYST